jgi:hypothetical protein
VYTTLSEFVYQDVSTSSDVSASVSVAVFSDVVFSPQAASDIISAAEIIPQQNRLINLFRLISIPLFD